MSELGIILEDSETGLVAPHREPVGLTEWDWTDGNWSCDCNRAKAFGHWDLGGTCLGSRRYRVIDATGVPVERRAEFLREANRGYPKVEVQP